MKFNKIHGVSTEWKVISTSKFAKKIVLQTSAIRILIHWGSPEKKRQSAVRWKGFVNQVVEWIVKVWSMVTLVTGTVVKWNTKDEVDQNRSHWRNKTTAELGAGHFLSPNPAQPIENLTRPNPTQLTVGLWRTRTQPNLPVGRKVAKSNVITQQTLNLKMTRNKHKKPSCR